MKKSIKMLLTAGAILFGASILTGCTNSFCSNEDKAHILYAVDNGVTRYFNSESEATSALGEEDGLVGKLTESLYENNIYYAASYSFNKNLNNVLTSATSNNIRTPSLRYFMAMDNLLLKNIAQEHNIEKIQYSDLIDTEESRSLLSEYASIKYYNSKTDKKVWDSWNVNNVTIRTNLSVFPSLSQEFKLEFNIDECPTSDFVSFYQKNLNSKISAYRSCLTTKTGYFGNYNGNSVKMSGKDWGYAWNVGPLSGLLVFPIGWLVDVFTNGLLNIGCANGVAQLFSILIITVIVRGLMLLATFKQTAATAKMQELQPALAKIQAKYPNANSNQYEKQRLAQETAGLYKKNGINPLGPILMLIIQFPVFICVWSALQGSSILTNGAFLGLHLSDSISSVLTNWSNWSNPNSGVWTALVLFIVMSAVQVVSMLLPQWLQKRKLKNVSKLGRNPSQTQQNKNMKIFTYVMMIMIIFMGFSLASAMGVYWLVSALISVVQSLITHFVSEKKKSKNNKVVG